MGTKRLLDYDPVARLATYHKYDDQTQTTWIEYEQDAEPHVDFSKALQNDPTYRARGVKANRLHFAHVPTIVQMEWVTKYGVRMWDKNHRSKVMSLLNSPEYKHLRTVNRL